MPVNQSHANPLDNSRLRYPKREADRRTEISPVYILILDKNSTRNDLHNTQEYYNNNKYKQEINWELDKREVNKSIQEKERKKYLKNYRANRDLLSRFVSALLIIENSLSPRNETGSAGPEDRERRVPRGLINALAAGTHAHGSRGAANFQ